VVAGLLSMAKTAVSSSKVADEVGSSAVNSKYSNDPRTLPWGMPA
jgi:hypothetical protein